MKLMFKRVTDSFIKIRDVDFLITAKKLRAYYHLMCWNMPVFMPKETCWRRKSKPFANKIFSPGKLKFPRQDYPTIMKMNVGRLTLPIKLLWDKIKEAVSRSYKNRKFTKCDYEIFDMHKAGTMVKVHSRNCLKWKKGKDFTNKINLCYKITSHRK